MDELIVHAEYAKGVDAGIVPQLKKKLRIKGKRTSFSSSGGGT